MELIASHVFKNFPTEVITKAPQKPTYYVLRENKVLPQFYKKDLGIYWEYIDGLLCDLSDNTPVIKNLKKTTKPTAENIMGNMLHSALFNGSGSKYTVFKVKDMLTEYFKSEIKKKRIVKIKSFPIILEMKFYMDLTNQSMDEDGIRLFPDKIFRDCIQETMYVRPKQKGQRGVKVANPNAWIPNDNIKYIKGSNFRVYHTLETPYLIVNFYNYTDQLELECEYRNIPYEPSQADKNSSNVKKAIIFTELEFKTRGAMPYDLNGEVLEAHRTQFTRTYEKYFNILTEM